VRSFNIRRKYEESVKKTHSSEMTLAEAIALSTDFRYIFRWSREGRMGQRCRVLACGTMYTCLVEFADGFRMVTTTNALKKAEPDSNGRT
jgi:hypothetical protein